DRNLGPVAIIKANARHLEDACAPLRPDWKVLRHLAYYCWERSGLLDSKNVGQHADALLALSAHWPDWQRPLEGWVPPEETDMQFSSLARHLLARYDVPRFLDAAWRKGLTIEGFVEQNWFKLIGMGHSIR